MATILIVEDEFAIAELLEMVLADEGHSVVIAANGRQALEQLAQGPKPDLIITDFMMPILDAAGLLKELGKNKAQRNIPCIIISSMPEETVRQRIEKYAAFVRKPFQLAQLARLVDTFLSTPGLGAEG